MSLDELPAPILGIILSYISDPISICRLECTCKSIRSIAVKNASSCWYSLYKKQWNLSKQQQRLPSAMSTTTIKTTTKLLMKEEYKRRYELDRNARKQIQNLSTIMDKHGPEYIEIMHIVMDLMSHGGDVMEICRKIWEDQSKEEDDVQNATRLSIGVYRFVHAATIFEEILFLCQNGLDDPTLELEKFAIISSRLLFDVKKESPEETCAWITHELDEIGEKVNTLLLSKHGEGEKSPEQKLECLNIIFFEELGFSGNVDDYYNVANSLLHLTLKLRKAIPMTLCLLYSCIGRRIGLEVNIIGLPGHIVCRVPTLEDYYVDVFRRGSVLSSRDCEIIANTYGYVLIPEFLQPLSPAHVFIRILNNLENALRHLPLDLLVLRTFMEAMRTIVNNPTEEQVADCVRRCAQFWITHPTRLMTELRLL